MTNTLLCGVSLVLVNGQLVMDCDKINIEAMKKVLDDNNYAYTAELIYMVETFQANVEDLNDVMTRKFENDIIRV